MKPQLRYVEGDYLKANGVGLRRVPITVEGESRPLGRLDGIVIDVRERRVCSLVVAGPTGAREMLPLDVTRVNADGALVISAQDATEARPFDPSAYARYDDDAMVSLLFGSPAAA